MIITKKFRLKDKHASHLNSMAREVNYIWNFANETRAKAASPQYVGKRKFLSGFDLINLTSGYVKEYDSKLNAQSVQAICEEVALRGKQFKKTKLKWRTNNPKSSKKSLGWIPFKSSAIKFVNGQIRYNGHFFNFWDSYDLPKDTKILCGSFNQDARGRWYINLVIDEPIKQSSGTGSIALDFGVKDIAGLSDGTIIEAQMFYKKSEEKLAKSQRARTKKKTRSIHAKIANQRKDYLHKFSSKLIAENAAIFVGNVSLNFLLSGNSGKKTRDHGIGMFKDMLKYKSHQAGVIYEVIDEKYSTQTCSCCGVIPISSPKGSAGLWIREWTCCECNTTHDRDVNAAKVILARGHSRLRGISCKQGE
jgi:IS605 OrfB family transposase